MLSIPFVHFVVGLAILSCCLGSPLHHIDTHAENIDNVSQLRASYDYVVIGGGTSGLVVANRLTENPDSKHRLNSVCEEH